VELGEAFRQLRQHLRTLLDERTRMLAAIAHDYRTYLTRMDLRSEFIEDEEQRALAARISRKCATC
jgi:signal transduction histidine kinase